jgi:hypothetical protein
MISSLTIALLTLVAVLAASPPTLRAVDTDPLTVRATGFKPREQVKLVVSSPFDVGARVVRSDARGRFRVTFRLSFDRCDAFTVRATGQRGTRARLQFDAPLCASP